jgi:hypothetical protein
MAPKNFFLILFFMFFLGKGDEWARARTMQQKMGRTRSHVESRILEITEILAPPLGRSYRLRRIQDPADHRNLALPLGRSFRLRRIQDPGDHRNSRTALR